MIRRFPDLLERTLAGGVLACGMAVSFWLQWDAAWLDRHVTARGAQLDHLHTMAAPRCVGHLPRLPHGVRGLGPGVPDAGVGAGSTSALAGVFPGHRVVWLDTPVGPVLGLEPMGPKP
ncbi:MAG: hypothetical protein NXI31_15655 [bacterium]|nr:hypothetical protein [bacterium]